jgi:integrase
MNATPSVDAPFPPAMGWPQAHPGDKPENDPSSDNAPAKEPARSTSRPTLEDVLSTYRASRALLVICIEPINRASAHLLRLMRVSDRDASEKTRIPFADELTHQLVMAYVAARVAEGVTLSTVHRELTTLKAALRLAMRLNAIGTMPFIPRMPGAFTRERILSAREIDQLVYASERSLAMKLLVALGLGTGARLGAIVELTWPQVRFEDRIVDYRAEGERASRRKGRAVVPIGPSVMEALEEARRHRTNDRVFGERSRSAIEREFKRMVGEIELMGVTPNVMRHTAATHLLKTVASKLASRMVGHRSVVTTEQIYGHLQVVDLKPAAFALNDLLTGGRTAPVSRPASMISLPFWTSDLSPTGRGEIRIRYGIRTDGENIVRELRSGHGVELTTDPWSNYLAAGATIALDTALGRGILSVGI